MDLRGDFLVIGGGIAGLRAAIELQEVGDVILLTKTEPAESNTGYAQGGIAAAVGANDSPERHGADTMAAGDGLCDDAAVRVLVAEGPKYVHELIDWGASFDRDGQGRLALAQEGAHGVRRVLHAKDATGREIARVLWQRMSGRSPVRIFGDTFAVRVLVEEGRCVGVAFIGAQGQVGEARAGATLLATGGAGQVYRETTNPRIATGDGIALAYRAGARVADLEFVQFHPTVLSVPGAPRFLLSEALRGEGGRLVNHRQERFAHRYDPAGELAARDVVARAIAQEAERTGHPVALTLAHLDPAFVHDRFPAIAAVCQAAGLDLARDPIPVSPAAHYVMGGVETDRDGRTSIPGLFAAGEVACTRVHGANRLASNSLLEGLVFGARAGRAMRDAVAPSRLADPVFRPLPAQAPIPAQGGEAPASEPLTSAEVKDLMWATVGLTREGPRLRQAVSRLDVASRELEGRLTPCTDPVVDRWRQANLLMVARLITRAALRREESRGAHFRRDFPVRNDRLWTVHVTEPADSTHSDS